MHRWHVYHQLDQASKAGADFLLERINESLQSKGICRVILPGGNTPGRCLNYLLKAKLAWQNIHWYLGDERCYPPGHAERNDVMLQAHLWSHIDKPQVYRIPAELGAEQGALRYRETIAGIDAFDIAFLGMGEDGHTASLFPANKALADTRSVVPVYHSPKAPDDRVSLSIATLRKARYRMVLTAGVEKAAIINQVKENISLPVNAIGDIDWFVDKAAAG
ncbi:6-phosphogluconolactonase, eukaryotic type [hydrothermal vent metagenome]|uniref:6-phosphogluconolactonase, eukaryotic type n=1 Tax=hydrothermal vent metagenome TaxID=652676 RepID=A0A3B0YC96_9ZZZZ